MVNKLLHDATKKLINSDTPLLDARVLLSSITHENTAMLFRDLTKKEITLFNKYIDMRMQGIPVAYIVGEKEFMGYPFFVDTSTLIPRPDTECLVEKVLEKNSVPSPSILDLCTGSGCIGITLALMIENATADLTDISKDALKIVEKNVSRHGLKNKTKIYSLDVINDEIKNKYDIITANPPYIPSSLVVSLDVSKYEPTTALDGGNDGLDFYRIIIKKAYNALNSGGMLALEIGYDQGEAVSELMKEAGFTGVTVKQDYAGLDRVVYGYYEEET